MMPATAMPYNRLSTWLKGRFGEKVYKITINSGLSCPNRDGTKAVGGCVYCSEDALLPKDMPASSVKNQIKNGMEHIRRRHNARKFVAYFQIATNTHAPVEKLREIFSEALGFDDVVCLAVSTRPDCLGRDVMDLLCEIREKKPLWLELGLQSSNDATLERINRRHDSAEFDNALGRANERKIDVCAHVILGLPGESRKDMLNTARFLAARQIWGIKFHQLQVLANTPLEADYLAGNLRLLALEEYVNLVVECLELMPPELVIHRLCSDSPERYLIAPKWGVNKFIITERVLKSFCELKTYQGAKFQRL